MTELFIFARFHGFFGWPGCSRSCARPAPATQRRDSDCRLTDLRPLRLPVAICARFSASRWKDAAAFDHHAQLPHTVRFVEKVQTLIDHPLDVTRTWPLA